MPSNPDLGETRYDLAHVVPDSVQPGCRLYHLAPYAVGSGRCEGLVSYINRLARAHCVNPRKLVRYVFAEVDPGIAQLHRDSFYVSYVGTANGLGEYAKRLSTAANLLTGHADLALLTLLPWKNVLPVNGEWLISRHPRWCVPCLIEQLAETEETYYPLVWSLKLYNHCVKHQCALHDRCPQCGRRQPHLPKVPDGVFCCYCRSSLLSSYIAPLDEGVSLGTERAIEATIARNGDLVDIATRERFIRTLKFLLEQTAHGNRAAFCRIMGWNEWALNGWLKNGQKITFPKLLEIALRFGINPVDLCIGALAPTDLPRVKSAAHSAGKMALTDRAQKPQLPPAQRKVVQDHMQVVLQSAAVPPSLANIAARFGLTRGGLKYWFPELCAEISARRKRMRLVQVVLAREERKELVAHAVADIITQGRSPSRRSVDATISDFGLALARPEVFRTYRAALEASMDLLNEQPYDQADRYS